MIGLMVIIAIIGVLASIAIPNFISYRKKGLMAKAQAELKSLEKTIKVMALDSLRYFLIFFLIPIHNGLCYEEIIPCVIFYQRFARSPQKEESQWLRN